MLSQYRHIQLFKYFNLNGLELIVVPANKKPDAQIALGFEQGSSPH